MTGWERYVWPQVNSHSFNRRHAIVCLMRSVPDLRKLGTLRIKQLRPNTLCFRTFQALYTWFWTCPTPCRPIVDFFVSHHVGHLGHHVQLHVSHFVFFSHHVGHLFHLQSPCWPPCPPPCQPPHCRLDALCGLWDRMEIRNYDLRTDWLTGVVARDACVSKKCGHLEHQKSATYWDWKRPSLHEKFQKISILVREVVPTLPTRTSAVWSVVYFDTLRCCIAFWWLFRALWLFRAGSKEDN